jgi:hypothetical protein
VDRKKERGDRSRGRTEKKRLITAEASEEMIHVFFSSIPLIFQDAHTYVLIYLLCFSKKKEERDNG